ncbi:hypothetical protein [Antricoccus suffuscus]|uniref:hypothetical protein n=1 Tax=Antricoccus suffuscus TaxID=1629062 RepID=UPI00147476B1|nr:hypothetical protein [Antricoccus suffuscus]
MAHFPASRASKGTPHSDGIIFVPVASTPPLVAAGAGGNLRPVLGVSRSLEPSVGARHEPADQTSGGSTNARTTHRGAAHPRHARHRIPGAQ